MSAMCQHIAKMAIFLLYSDNGNGVPQGPDRALISIIADISAAKDGQPTLWHTPCSLRRQRPWRYSGVGENPGSRRGRKKRGRVMERPIERMSGRLMTILRCVSVAFQQARQSEIEVPAKRRFQLLYEAGNTHGGNPLDSRPGGKDLVTRAGIGIKAFLGCCSEANERARQSEIDVLARRSYRKSRETGSQGTGFQGPGFEGGEIREEAQRAPHEGGSGPSLAVVR